MKSKNKLYLGMMVALFLGACGGTSGTSDPLSKYDVKGGQPHNTPRETVKTIGSGKIEIRQLGVNASTVAQNSFIEEQSGQIRFEVIVRDPRITRIHVDISKFPQSPNLPTLERVGESTLTGEFALNWTPPRGHLPPGVPSQTHAFTLTVKVEEAALPELMGLIVERELLLNVSKTQSVPRIVEFTDLKNGVEEGQLVPFRVVVEDSSAKDSGLAPRLDFHDLPQSNTEAICVNMRSRITNQDPTKVVERISNSRFEFKYVIDTRNLPNAYDRRGRETSTADKVQLCFGMSARNSDNGISGEVRVQTDGRYSVREPELTWADNNSTTVLPAKQSTELRFEISESSQLGEVSVPQNQISALRRALRSQVELSCEDSNVSASVSKKVCTLKVTPECPSSSQRQRPLESAVKMTLKVENKLGTRVRTKDFTRDFKILADETNCPVSRSRSTGAGENGRRSTPAQPRAPRT